MYYVLRCVSLINHEIAYKKYRLQLGEFFFKKQQLKMQDCETRSLFCNENDTNSELEISNLVCSNPAQVDINFFFFENVYFIFFFFRMIPSTSDGLTVKKIQVKNPPICLNYLPSHEQAHEVFIYTNLITNSIRLLQMPYNGWYNQTGKIHAFKKQDRFSVMKEILADFILSFEKVQKIRQIAFHF